MYSFTLPSQRFSLYENMPNLRALSTESYGIFKHLPIPQMPINDVIESFLNLLERDQALSDTWAELTHYDRVVNDRIYRDLHAQELEAYEAHSNAITLDPILYNQFIVFKSALKASQSPEEFRDPLVMALDLIIKQMKKAGSHLNQASRHKLQSLALEISSLEQKFEENNLDASEKIVLNCQASELKGLSDGQLGLLKIHPETQLYQINRTPLCRQIIMEYAEDRSLREQYYKYCSKKCGPTEGDFNNLYTADKILKLKKERAKVLGFSSYRAFQVSDRFAESEDNIEDFYTKFFTQVPLHAHKEQNRLRAFAWERDQIEIQPWDAAFYSRLEEESLLNINEEELSHYFPVDFVTEYMLRLFENLYQLKFEVRSSVEADCLWNESLKIVEVYVSESNRYIGRIYLDLFQRPGKMSGAWLSEFQSFSSYPKDRPTIVFCICNTQSEEQFLFEELQTLYHEFGHALHALLSQKSMAICSGIDDVPWDIVELPSILSEQWVSNPEDLKKMSLHLVSGESLSDQWISAIVLKSQYGAGKFLLRQMIFGFYDWSAHGTKVPENLLDLWQNIAGKYAVMPILKEDTFPMTFTHIFSGGYSAGYYSYLWAEVYVHQVYKKLKDRAQKSSWQDAGKLFKEAFLSQGSVDGLKKRLEDFLEEPLSIDPLLQHYGLYNEDIL